jgi:uncharacterized repeat protein (TIGR01451 family)
MGRLWQRRVNRLPALAAVATLAAGVVVIGTPTPALAQGTALVSETFTGETADPRFEAFGSACLTGAPGGAPPGQGEHELGSCSANAVGPAPPRDAAPFGYLQLTDSAEDQSGAALFNQPIPADDGLDVTFEQWQYGNLPPTNPNLPNVPADGISFFLINGEGDLTAPGAFGGSLGYAQKLPDDDPDNEFQPGVNDGYLGIGLDVLGNYFGDWEHRGNGCPQGQRSPAGTGFRNPPPGRNMVTVRGPGNDVLGYCFQTATATNLDSTAGPWQSTLPDELQGPTPADLSDDPETAQAQLEPTRRTVRVTITPAPNPHVTVFVDFNDREGLREVLSFDAPEPVPPTYKFGFAGSTGDLTDVHLIRNVSVSSRRLLPALDLVKQVRIEPPLPPVLGIGAQIPYEFVVTNTGGTPISNLVVTDDTVGRVSCPDTTLDPGQTTVCTATYTVTAADVARGFVRNTAVASGIGSNETTVTSPESEFTLPLGGRVALALIKETDVTRTYRVGDVVDYTYVVTNVSANVVSGVRIQDDRVSGITCEATTLQPVNNPGANSTICRGRFTVTAADAANGSVTNTAVAIGNGGAVVSPPATVTIKVRRVPGLPITGMRLAPVAGSAAALVLLGSAMVAGVLMINKRRRGKFAGE